MDKRIVTAGLAGNVLEWYDFAVYGYFAAVIGRAFFPAAHPELSLFLSLGVFAIGFLARPLGGLYFGAIGDRIGRRHALVVSTFMMAIPSTLIGVMPSYDSIGVAAPVALIVCRLLQGASVGGELTSSVTYLLENAPKNRRAFWASFAIVGAVGGILLGSTVAAIMTRVLSEEQIAHWGWRIPFLLGSVIAVSAMYLRRVLPDDAAPRTEESSSASTPLLITVREHWGRLLLTFGIMTFVAVNFYMMYIYLSTFMSDVAGLPRAISLEINTISMVVLIPMILLGAWLADQYSAATVMKVSAGLWIVLAYPLLALLDHPDPRMALAGQFGLTMIFGPYNGVASYYVALLFPRAVRMSATSLASNCCFAILGGTAPMMSTFLVGELGPLSLAWYAIAAGCVGLGCTIGSSRLRTTGSSVAPQMTLAD
ncbi:MAG: MFS transporter [Hyphomicrobium sp.]